MIIDRIHFVQHCKAKVSGSYARIDGYEATLFLPETERKTLVEGKNEVKITQLRLSPYLP